MCELLLVVKVFLDGRQREEVEPLLSAKTFGTPALVIAARNGHIDVVRYLVVEKAADVSVTGMVSFDGETIEGAPALWAAAAAGHLEIVTLLLDHGADVNQRTMTNSTPLRGACFDGHLHIVKFLVERGADVEVANRHGHSCLMIASFRRQLDIVRYLIGVGADVNKASLKGNTALHDAAEAGSLKILQLLLESGGIMRKDAGGISPVLSAASLGHDSVIEFLIQHPQCFWRERVECLLLAGATSVDKRRDLGAAISYWKRALTLLVQPPSAGRDGEPAEPPTRSDKLKERIPAYAFQKEMTTIAELEEKMAEPDLLRMQALIIRERILGPTHADTIYYLRYRGAIYADVGRFDRCIQLWMHALTMQQKSLEPLCTMTQGTIISFAELFAFMLNEHLSVRPSAVQAPSFDDIFPVAEITVAEIRRGMQQMSVNEAVPSTSATNAVVTPSTSTASTSASVTAVAASPSPSSSTASTSSAATNGDEGEEEEEDEDEGLEADEGSAAANSNYQHIHGPKELRDSFHKLAMVLLHLICLISRVHAATWWTAMKPKLNALIYQVVRLDPKDGQGRSLLHLSCSSETSTIGRFPVCRFPSLDVVKCLLESGADPNAVDLNGRSPLHVLLENNTIGRPSIMKCLLSFGAHLDLRSKNGERPSEMMTKKRLDIPLIAHSSLKCTAARVIQEAGIPYRKYVPQSLHAFIQMH